MPVLDPGQYRHWVDLDDPDPDTARTITPSRVKCAIRPQASAGDESQRTYQVLTRFHAGITLNTRLRHTDARGATHHLYVRGIENADMLDRDLVLICEEVPAP